MNFYEKDLLKLLWLIRIDDLETALGEYNKLVELTLLRLLLMKPI